MTNYYYYPAQPAGHMQTYPAAPGPYAQQPELNMLLDAAKTGAIIGAAGAGAMQIHRYQNEGISWQEAATGTVKGAFQVGLAATAATAVGRLFHENQALSLAATLATGTAVMYLLNRPEMEGEVEDE